jgi:hypothetical protein
VLALVRRLCYLMTPPGYEAPGFPLRVAKLPELLDNRPSQRAPYWLEAQHQGEFIHLYDEIRDILTWLHPRPIQTAHEVLRAHTAQTLERHGVQIDEILKIVDRLNQPRRGAPANEDMRIAAVKALELRLKAPGNSWVKVARSVCPCGERQHDNRCTQRVRQSVMRLNRALDKYGV